MNAQGGPTGRLEAWRALGRRVRNGWRAWLTSRTGGGVLTTIVVVALVMTALPNGRPQSTSEPAESPRPTTTPAATLPPDQAWGDLTLPAWEPVAELRPVDTDASGVAVGSTFLLRSRTSVPATDLAAGLTAEPAVDFDVQPGDSPAEARLVPAAPLAEGLLYRFRLINRTGALAGSWAYRTERPLRVVGTVPGDRTTGVPVDTGIEIEFDQDGVTDIGGQFSIEPTAAGRFEVRGRTVIFAPNQPLAPATIYRVTISAGVTMTGSDQVLEAPVSFAFETSTPAGSSTWDVGLGRPILEASPSERPVVALDLRYDDQTGPAPTSVPFEVYRLPSFEAARVAAVTLAGGPAWGDWSSGDLVPTDGLARVAAFDGTFELQMRYGYSVVRFPAPLDAGWYLVVVPREGRDRQALLQVTDLAAYALTSETRTLAWVNDRATGEPIHDAILRDPSGARVGTTAANGLLDVATPAALLRAPDGTGSSDATLVTVTAPDGRRLLLALGQRSNTSAYDSERSGSSRAAEADNRWWLLFSTDRTTYRSTDTINAWGLIRSRDDGSVPSGLEVTLRTSEASSVDGPWLARIPLTTTARGAWAQDIALDGLPLGSYVVELRAAGVVAASSWVEVAEIRKPAYRIDVQTDRRAAISGDPVTISARAVFFDGTSAAGLDLRVDAFGASRVLTADADGRVTLTVPAREGWDGISFGTVSVAPATPEEGQISGYADVVVIPSAVWLKGSGTVRDGRAVIEGTMSRVDLARVEDQLALGAYPEDPSGAPISGGTVTVRVVEVVPTQKQVGTTYDYIEKKVVPLIEYSYANKSIGTYATTSGEDGAITLSVPIPSADHRYEVTLTSRDGTGRTASTTLYVSSPDALPELSGPARPYLEKRGECGYYSEERAVGDTIRLTMRDGDGTVSTGGRYLFVVAGRGIRDTRLQDTGTLTRIYTEADLPSLDVIAVRFKDGAYAVTNEVLIRTRPDGRTLGVELTADRSRYAPGDRATVTVRTTDADGRPVPADVVIRGVDEKLFAIGQAFDVDALATLLAPTGDGLLQSYASHPVPMTFAGCGGDAAGGGRDDFRDSVVFRLVSTGTDGMESVSFALPDDLTSWRLSATALASDLRVGSGVLLVPVGLPFFTDAILASDYLAGERPVLRVRSFGDDLATGDRVRFIVSAPSLLMPPTSVEAAAFATATLQLPELPLGVHELTISATVIGDATRTDTLVRKLVVRSSRLEVAATEVTTPAGAAALGGAGLTTYVVTDAGRGSLVPRLRDLTNGGGARFDRLIVAGLARDLLVGTFGFDEATLPPTDVDIGRYERGGVALLPYSSPDLALTAMTAIVTPERLAVLRIRAALQTWREAPSATEERQIIALAGLAGLGDDVLDELRAVDVATVSVREALWVALGLVASGDEDGARTIERMLLDRYGQELGPWVRLDVGDSMVDTLDAASLLALVATGIGDPLAPRIDRYLREMRTTEALYVLPQIGVIRWSLDRLPRAAARFAWTVDGVRQVEALEPGASWAVTLTERQRAGFRLESIEGSLAVVASWAGTPGPGDLPSGGLVTITRTVTPVDDAPTTGLVKVRLRVVFDPTAPTGCWEVTDRTPSGLAPVVAVPGWAEDLGTARPVNAPWDVSGQRVGWCIDPVRSRDVQLGYSARVVSAGTFTWEPAMIQSVAAPEIGATTPVTTYTIR